MSSFYNLKIAAKLIIGFVLVALIAGIVGFIGIINIKEIDGKYSDLYTNFGAVLYDVGNADADFLRVRNNLRDMVLDRGSKDREKYKIAIAGLNKKIDEDLTKFEKSVQTREVREEFDKAKGMFAKFSIIQERIISLAMDNHEDEALALMRGEGRALAQDIDASLAKLSSIKITKGNERSEEYTGQTNRTITMMLITIAVAMLVALSLGYFIARIISNPVKQLVEVADRMALGDVEVSVTATTKDEIGQLMASFARMIENIREQVRVVERIANGDLTVEVEVRSDKDLLGKKLKEMVQTNNEVLTGINAAAEQVASGSRQVSSSAQALSQGAAEQASSIEEVTSSMNELAEQTRLNAVNAGEANLLSVKAQEDAVQGNRRMNEMVGAMTEINESSENISKIIKVIDEIAFQTNILALNAAVEAARAGQHGKGFAVVAEEVRNLAARSANAAKETTAMIESSIKKVEAGSKIANDTQLALNNIVEGVSKAAALVKDISDASNVQATGISQINTAIEQVSTVIQTNSATAEESASASEELSSQAELLKETISRYKLKNGERYPGSYNRMEHETGRPVEATQDKRYSKPAVAKTKPKIVLDETDFGKY